VNAVGREVAFTSLEELQTDRWLRRIALNTPPNDELYYLGSGEHEQVGDLPNNVLREVLALGTDDNQDNMPNWIQRLANHLDSFSDELDGSDIEFGAPIYLHPALYALATEGYVKHDLEFDELIEYLIDVILGE
jgi:hypothetical protein